MLIIVEGVDGVGKTTFVRDLVHRISREFPDDEIQVLHRGPPETSEMLEEYELPLQSYFPSERKHVICDRWHLGELIYGPLLRGKSMLDVPRLRHIELFLKAKGAVLAYLTAPLREIIRRRGERDKDDLLEDVQVWPVMMQYSDLATRANLYSVNVHWDNDPASRRNWVALAINRAREEEARALWAQSFPTYVGSTRHRGMILCGERRNQNSDDRWDSAFVPVSGSSGHYLLTALYDDQLPSLGVVNACEADMRSLAVMSDATFVSLGKEAHAVLSEAGVVHGAVPHPQYVRRFHHGYAYDYQCLINRVATTQEDLTSWRPS